MERKLSWWRHPATYLILLVLTIGTLLVAFAVHQALRLWSSLQDRVTYMPGSQEVFKLRSEQDLAFKASIEAQLLALQGRREEALVASDRAVQHADLHTDKQVRRAILIHRSLLLLHLGRPGLARLVAQQVISESQNDEDPLLEGLGHLLSGSLAINHHSYSRAAAELELARSVTKRVPAGGWNGLNAALLEVGISANLLAVYDILLESPDASTSLRIDLEMRCRATASPLLCQQGLVAAAMVSRTALTFFVRTSDSQPKPWRLYHWAKSLVGHLPKDPSAGGKTTADQATCSWRGQTLVAVDQVRDRPSATPLQNQSLFWLATLQLNRSIASQEAHVLEALRAGESEFASYSLRNLTGLLWASGEFDSALEAAAAAAACFDQVALLMENSSSLTAYAGGFRADFLGDLFDMLWLEQRYDEAFWVAERTRARALLRSVGSGVERKEAPPANLFSQQLADLADQISAAERDGALGVGAARQAAEQRIGELRRAQEGLLTRAASLSPEFSSLVNPASPTIEEIQSELEPDVTVVSYFYRERDLHAWVIDRDRSTPFLLATSPDLAWATTCYAAEVRGTRRPDSRCRDDQQLAEELYRQLVAPLRPAIRHRRLIIVPHGSLHFLPFAALRNASTGRTLVDDFIVTHLPSASVLRFLRDKESPFLGRALVLGDPRPANKQLSLLPGSRAEAEAVAALFGTTPGLAEAASETALDLAPDSFDVIHIAAHGIHLPGAPRASHIALSPTVGGHDGKLEAHEIYSRLNWTGVNLVVLSACETALGERSRGDDIVGLTRAILYAGASGVVSTLWPVEDRASADLMLSFYQHLRAGRSAAEALREAQLEIRRQPGFEHPHFWAGFVLTGDPRARWSP